MVFGVNCRHISLLYINDPSDKLSDCKCIHGLSENQHRKWRIYRELEQKQ